jgi:hypothetical protein
VGSAIRAEAKSSTRRSLSVSGILIEMLCCYLIKLDTCDRVEGSMRLVGKTKLIKHQDAIVVTQCKSLRMALKSAPLLIALYNSNLSNSFSHSTYKCLIRIRRRKSSRSTDHSENMKGRSLGRQRQAQRSADYDRLQAH